MPSMLVSADLAAADMAAVAQHGVAVADLEDFLEAMRHEDRRDAFALQAADDGEEVLDLGAAERAGRLVHHDEARLHGERAGDLHHLLLGDRKIAHQRARAALEADALAQRFRLLFQLAVADEEARARLAADEHILRHRHVGGEGEFLVDGDDAGLLGLLRGGEAHGLAVEFDRPLIGRLGAREDLEERRLAGTVLAEEGVDFRLAHLEVDGLERPHAGKGLGNPPHAQKR